MIILWVAQSCAVEPVGCGVTSADYHRQRIVHISIFQHRELVGIDYSSDFAIWRVICYDDTFLSIGNGLVDHVTGGEPSITRCDSACEVSLLCGVAGVVDVAETDIALDKCISENHVTLVVITDLLGRSFYSSSRRVSVLVGDVVGVVRDAVRGTDRDVGVGHVTEADLRGGNRVRVVGERCMVVCDFSSVATVGRGAGLA